MKRTPNKLYPEGFTPGSIQLPPEVVEARKKAHKTAWEERMSKTFDEVIEERAAARRKREHEAFKHFFIDHKLEALVFAGIFVAIIVSAGVLHPVWAFDEKI